MSTQVVSQTPSTPAPAAPATQEAPVTQTTPASSTTQDPPATGSEGAVGDPPGDGVTQDPPPFKSTLEKIRVMDQEHEVPKWLKEAIKDADTEKQAKELMELSLGFKHAKPKHEQTQQSFQQLKSQWERVENGYSRLGELAKSDDRGSFVDFLKFWGVDEEKLLHHAAQVLRYRELAPEERTAEDRQYQRQVESRRNAGTATRAQQELIQERAQMRGIQLDTALSRPDIASAVQSYNQRAGKPSAFKERVIRTAQYHALTSGKDISVEEAVHEVMQELGYELGEEGQTGASQPGMTQAPSKVVATVPQQKLPVIPNTGATQQAAPVKKTFKSIADLEAERTRLLKAGG